MYELPKDRWRLNAGEYEKLNNREKETWKRKKKLSGKITRRNFVYTTWTNIQKVRRLLFNNLSIYCYSFDVVVPWDWKCGVWRFHTFHLTFQKWNKYNRTRPSKQKGSTLKVFAKFSVQGLLYFFFVFY